MLAYELSGCGFESRCGRNNYYLLIIIIIIITKSRNNDCSVGVMELCLLNLLILIDCFLCNSYPCVLFESLSHVINQESHVYSWNLEKIYLIHFLKFWNLSKLQKSELGKLIPNFSLKRVITSTNLLGFLTTDRGSIKVQPIFLSLW